MDEQSLSTKRRLKRLENLVAGGGAQGPQGAQGAQGAQGSQGAQGAQGAAGADGQTVLRVVLLGSDKTTGAGPAGFAHIIGMSTGAFTPTTANVLIRVVASVSFTMGAGFATGALNVDVAFAGGQVGTLSPGSSSASGTNGEFATIVYEATLTGLTPGIANSVTIQVQWAINTAGGAMICDAFSAPDNYSMTLTAMAYA